MKQLLSYASLLLFAGAFLSGCQQDPNSTGSPRTQLPLSNPHGSTTAHPALVYTGAVITTSHKTSTTYSAIYVADTDMGNRTSVQVATTSTSSVLYGATPGWSPNGSSICFTQSGEGSPRHPDSIKAFDVSVNSSGVPVGSNVRTVFGLPSNSVRLKNPFWSSTTTMGKIAYSTQEAGTNSLYVVSQSGGTPTLIYRVDTSWVHYALPLGDPTWSPDDSKLACLRIGSNGTVTTIMIFGTTDNGSTWTYNDSISVSGGVDGLEWSRNGSVNELTFGLVSGGTSEISFVTPTTGATPVTSFVAGVFPTWSPNNSSVMYVNAGYLYKNTPLTTSTTTVTNFGGLGVKWKR